MQGTWLWIWEWWRKLLNLSLPEMPGRPNLEVWKRIGYTTSLHTWVDSWKLYVFSVVHCLNAPEPPSEANLTLRDYDPLSPRRRGGHLNYTCSAGGYNKFASDFSKRRYTLTCNDDNNYETPDWPTCVSSKCCCCILKWHVYFQQHTVQNQNLLRPQKSDFTLILTIRQDFRLKNIHLEKRHNFLSFLSWTLSIHRPKTR